MRQSPGRTGGQGPHRTDGSWAFTARADSPAGCTWPLAQATSAVAGTITMSLNESFMISSCDWTPASAGLSGCEGPDVGGAEGLSADRPVAGLDLLDADPGDVPQR